MVGKIERVPLRDIWKHEDYDFTSWLQDNIDVLNDALGLSLSNPESEQSARSFNVDLLAEDETGNPVIIENQLEKSDHNHLGKLITYLTAIGAKTAVWIVEDPRPEHVGAISWLNESSSANFYLSKVEGIKIGDSESAPLLTLIVGPSEESREVGEKKKEIYFVTNFGRSCLKEQAKSRNCTQIYLRDRIVGSAQEQERVGWYIIILSPNTRAKSRYTLIGERTRMKKIKIFLMNYLSIKTKLKTFLASN